ncbi:predicted protein [Nematostella vectensis]|uniref:TLDc domain-containing protein n=1 Tax=Nematostella vectensis TaxID=45351 RepID=A7SUR2_NEMVE|nr:predicted protein [Nematostella vectensis]|eukprot:XP_001624669.1 predicted protein [Nematostella vectensis]
MFFKVSDRGYQSSSRSFLFTLCNKNGYRPEKLPLRRTPDEYAICDRTRFGPVFGGPVFGGDCDLYIAYNAGGKKASYTEPHTYARPQGATSDGMCDVFAGTCKFTPDEMEVFHECRRNLLGYTGDLFHFFSDPTLVSDRGYQSSSRSFLFTLCNKNGYRPEKLPLRRTPDEKAICDHTGCGPVFGGDSAFGDPWFGFGCDLLIDDNAGGEKTCSTEPYKYARPQGASSDGPCDVFAGTLKFTPDEMEVFHEVVD